MDDPRPASPQSVSGHLKICEQPCRTRRCGAGQIRNHLLQFLGRETIEKKMRDNQIERLLLRLPGESVRVNEFDALRIKSALRQAFARGPQHPGTGVHDSGACRRKLPSAFYKEATVPFADNQDMLRSIHSVQKQRAAVLQLLSGEHTLHPAVMARERIKAHGTERTEKSVRRFHQRPARIPPTT